MKKIKKIKAIMLGVKDNSYVLKEISTNNIFHIDVGTMHEKVVFPPGIINNKGLIKASIQVSVVMKRTNSGNIVYLPDTSHYPSRQNDQHGLIKNLGASSAEKLAVETILGIAKIILKKNI